MAKSDLLKPERYNNLKARVKAEMLRRNKNGSVTSYGGAAYDYSVVPAKDGYVVSEHFEKLVTPLRAINRNGMPNADVVNRNVTDADMATMEAKLSAFESKPSNYHASSGTGDCMSACTGLCVTQCSGGCSGTCSGSCTGGCDTTCRGGCYTTCKGRCSARCANSCSGGCDGGCEGCGSGCESNCDPSCSLYCTARCGGCAGDCGDGAKRDAGGSCNYCGSGCQTQNGDGCTASVTYY